MNLSPKIDTINITSIIFSAIICIIIFLVSIYIIAPLALCTLDWFGRVFVPDRMGGGSSLDNPGILNLLTRSIMVIGLSGYFSYISSKFFFPDVRERHLIVTIIIILLIGTAAFFASVYRPNTKTHEAVVNVYPSSPAPVQLPMSAAAPSSYMPSTESTRPVLSQEEIDYDWKIANEKFKSDYPEVFNNPILLQEANKKYYAKIEKGFAISQAMDEAGKETMANHPRVIKPDIAVNRNIYFITGGYMVGKGAWHNNNFVYVQNGDGSVVKFKQKEIDMVRTFRE